MNVRWVILFAAVAQDLSFTRAAARLNVAQPWLSAQVRKLEAELGVTLFTRQKNRIELTLEGEELFPSALQIAEAAQRFRSVARDLGAHRGLTVRIGSHAPALTVPELARLNDQFVARYDTFSLVVEHGATETLLAAVAGNALDAALVLEPFDAEGFETLLLREQPPLVVAPRDGRWAGRSELTPQALAGSVLGVVPRALHPAAYDALVEPLRAAGVDVRPVPEPDGRAMEAYAQRHGAAVLMLEGEAARYRAHPELAALPLVGGAPLRHRLVRARTALPGRAADRYWRLAQGHALPEPG